MSQSVRPRHRRRSLGADLLRGAVAGAIGVWAMDRADWFMYHRESPRTRARTQAARPGGLDPAHVAANALARRFGRELSRPQPHPAGMAVHYAIGIAPGALYGALRERLPWVGAGRGLFLGLVLSVVEDELANPLLGLAGKPGRYPWQAHARGVAAHLVYGAATDLALAAMQPRPR